MERKGALPSLFYKASITLISKPDKERTKKENYRSTSLMNIDKKISIKYLQIKLNNILKRSCTRDSSMVQHIQINKCNTAYKKN
jgi:hypothetical protein